MNNSSNFKRHFCATRQNKKINKSIKWPIWKTEEKYTYNEEPSSLQSCLSLKRQEPRPQSLLCSQYTAMKMGSLQSRFYGYELTKNTCLAPTYTTSVLSHIATNRRISIYFRSMHFFTYYLTGNLPAQLPFEYEIRKCTGFRIRSTTSESLQFTS